MNWTTAKDSCCKHVFPYEIVVVVFSEQAVDQVYLILLNDAWIWVLSDVNILDNFVNGFPLLELAIGPLLSKPDDVPKLHYRNVIIYQRELCISQEEACRVFSDHLTQVARHQLLISPECVCHWISSILGSDESRVSDHLLISNSELLGQLAKPIEQDKGNQPIISEGDDVQEDELVDGDCSLRELELYLEVLLC